MKDEKNNSFIKVDEEVLRQVSGGTSTGESAAKFSVGQTVRCSYYHNGISGSLSFDTWVFVGTLCFSGKVVEVLQEAGGIRYRLEVDEGARIATGQTYLTVDEKDIIEVV